MKKLKKFAQTKFVKFFGSIAIGLGSMTPLAPFMPTIKEYAGGLSEAGENDTVAWGTVVIILVLIALVAFKLITMEQALVFFGMTDQ